MKVPFSIQAYNWLTRAILILAIHICPITTIAKTTDVIDSLKKTIQKQKADNIKLNQAYIKLSREFESINIDSALHYTDLAIDKAMLTSSIKDIIASYNRKVSILYNAGLYNQADSLVSLAILFSNNALDSNLVQCYSLKSKIAFRMGKYHLSLDNALEAVKIADEINSTDLKAKLIHNIGIIYTELGDYEQAIKNNLQGLRYFEEKGDKKNLANSYTNIGALYSYTNDFDKSLDYNEKSLKLYTELGDLPGQSLCHTNTGNIHFLKEEYFKALHYYNKSLEIDKKSNDLYNLSIDYNNLGNTYEKVKQFNKASELFKKALSINEQLKNSNGLAYSYLNLGSIEIKLNNIKQAEFYCLKSISIFEQENNLYGQWTAYRQLSSLYQNFKEYEKAYNAFLKSADFKDSLFDIDKAKKIAQLEEKYISEQLKKQNQLLSVEKELQQTVILQQTRLRKIYLLGLILSVAAIIVIVILNKKKANAYKHLVKKNLEVLMKDDEINIIKEQIYSETTETDSAIKSGIPKETRKQLIGKLNKLLNNDKIFKNSSLSLDKLAKRLSTNRSYLSQLINEEFNKNYTDYLNEFKVKEAMHLLSDARKANQYSIDAIAKEAGFKSVSRFNEIFKKNTGLTPSAFRNKAIKLNTKPID